MGYSTTATSPLPLNPDYTFEQFVTGPCNRLSHAASVAVGEQPGRVYNPLFIHGGVGLGKTHLLQAVCQKVLERQADARILYLSCDSFVNQFIESVGQGDMQQFRVRYRYVDMLVIDDIHFLTGHGRTQEEFFHTFNTLYQQQKQIILSADCSPAEIPELEERLVSRFNWGLVARIEKPCYETRMAILQKKARMRGLNLPDDVVCYIAGTVYTNTRELEGAITKIQSMSLLQNGTIDLELAKRAWGKTWSRKKSRSASSRSSRPSHATTTCASATFRAKSGTRAWRFRGRCACTWRGAIRGTAWRRSAVISVAAITQR